MPSDFEQQTDELLQLIEAKWICTLCSEKPLEWPDAYEIISVDGIWSPVGYCCIDMVYTYFADAQADAEER